MPRLLGAPILLGPMLSPDALAEVEGDALEMGRRAGVDLASPEPVPLGALAWGLLGTVPRAVDGLEEPAEIVDLGAGPEVLFRTSLPPLRARWIVAHELAEWWLSDVLDYVGEDIEERADALGAALVVPAPAFRAAVRERGHRIHQLAALFAVPPSLVLLRLGEVTGRPVVLLRATRPRARGGPFVWPARLEAAVVRPPPGVHPVCLEDESGPRWGLLADRHRVA